MRELVEEVEEVDPVSQVVRVEHLVIVMIMDTMAKKELHKMARMELVIQEVMEEEVQIMAKSKPLDKIPHKVVEEVQEVV